MPWKKQTATSAPRTLTGSGGTASEFRTAAAGISETADALAALATLFRAVAEALDADDAATAMACLEQLPAAYLRAGSEVDAIEQRIAPLQVALGLALTTAAVKPRK